MKIQPEDYDKVYIGDDLSLQTVMSHFRSIPILINALKDSGDHKTLSKWDRTRRGNEDSTRRSK